MTEQYVTKRKNGDTFYFKDAAKQILHRTDGPAIEYANGDNTWIVNGKLHRLDGPAVEWANGDKVWFVNGISIFTIHRTGEMVYKME